MFVCELFLLLKVFTEAMGGGGGEECVVRDAQEKLGGGKINYVTWYDYGLVLVRERVIYLCNMIVAGFFLPLDIRDIYHFMFIGYSHIHSNSTHQ